MLNKPDSIYFSPLGPLTTYVSGSIEPDRFETRAAKGMTLPAMLRVSARGAWKNPVPTLKSAPGSKPF